MADLALHWMPEEFAADLAVEANDLVRDEGLQTAVLLSLFTDRRAEPGDQLPVGETDRRGWWADAVPVQAGDQLGSRLWLLARSKQSADVLEQTERYAREALQWLLDDRVAERIEVTAEFVRAGVRGLSVEIFRPQKDPVTYRFDGSWDQLAAAAGLYQVPDEAPPEGVTTAAGADLVFTTGAHISAE